VSKTSLWLRRAFPIALAIGIWSAPTPASLTAPAWHLFAIFVAAIAAVLDGALPLFDLDDFGGGGGCAHGCHLSRKSVFGVRQS